MRKRELALLVLTFAAISSADSNPQEFTFIHDTAKCTYEVRLLHKQFKVTPDPLPNNQSPCPEGLVRTVQFAGKAFCPNGRAYEGRVEICAYELLIEGTKFPFYHETFISWEARIEKLKPHHTILETSLKNYESTLWHLEGYNLWLEPNDYPTSLNNNSKLVLKSDYNNYLKEKFSELSVKYLIIEDDSKNLMLFTVSNRNQFPSISYQPKLEIDFVSQDPYKKLAGMRLKTYVVFESCISFKGLMILETSSFLSLSSQIYDVKKPDSTTRTEANNIPGIIIFLFLVLIVLFFIYKILFSQGNKSGNEASPYVQAQPQPSLQITEQVYTNQPFIPDGGYTDTRQPFAPPNGY